MGQASNLAEYTTIPIYSILPDELLPCDIALLVNDKVVVFRAAGQVLEAAKFDRLIFKQFTELYIRKCDVAKHQAHCEKKQAEILRRINDPKLSSEERLAVQTVFDVDRITKELFASKTMTMLNQSLFQAVRVAQKSVEATCAKPYLRIFDWVPNDSQTIITHSIRVSLLTVFLAYQFGHVNAQVLSDLAAAGMLHDIGKTRIPLSDNPEQADAAEVEAMKQHPVVAAEVLKGSPDVTPETIRIILEHHENHDGSGYPRGLRGAKVDRLSRIFVIANGFDNIASGIKGPPEKRRQEALNLMKTTFRKQFDPELLPQALRLLTVK